MIAAGSRLGMTLAACALARSGTRGHCRRQVHSLLGLNDLERIPRWVWLARVASRLSHWRLVVLALASHSVVSAGLRSRTGGTTVHGSPSSRSDARRRARTQHGLPKPTTVSRACGARKLTKVPVSVRVLRHFSQFSTIKDS